MALLNDEKNKEQIESMRKNEAEDLAKLLAQKYNLPYLDLSRMTIDIDALKYWRKKKLGEANWRFSESRPKAPSGDRKPQSRDNSKSFKKPARKRLQNKHLYGFRRKPRPRMETIQRSACV